jgi:hypothetical protein
VTTDGRTVRTHNLTTLNACCVLCAEDVLPAIIGHQRPNTPSYCPIELVRSPLAFGPLAL